MPHPPYISYVIHNPSVLNVLMNVWGWSYLVAGPILLLGGAPAAGSALVGSEVGFVVGLFVGFSRVGSAPYSAVLASVPYDAIVGASVGMVVFGLVGLAWSPSGPFARPYGPLARHLNTLALATAVVGTLAVLGVHLVAPHICFDGPLTFTFGPGSFHFPRPHSGGSCLPEFALWAQALLVFDVAFLASLSLAQARRASATKTPSSGESPRVASPGSPRVHT